MKDNIEDYLKKMLDDYAEGLVEYRVNVDKNAQVPSIVSEKPILVTAAHVDMQGDLRFSYRYADPSIPWTDDMRGKVNGVLHIGNGDVLCLCKSREDALKTVAKFQHAQAAEKVKWLKEEIESHKAELAEAEEIEKKLAEVASALQ